MLDLELSEEQQLLQDSANRFIEREYDFADRRKAANSEEGFRRSAWKTFADLGWLAVGLPEDQGGFGGARETAVLMEAMGRGLVVEPYLATVVMAGKAVALAGDDAQKDELLGAVIGGTVPY